MVVPRSEAADVASVAAHYDDLDELYRDFWGTSLHHGYWILGTETPEQASDNLTRVVAQRAELQAGERICDLADSTSGPPARRPGATPGTNARNDPLSPTSKEVLCSTPTPLFPRAPTC